MNPKENKMVRQKNRGQAVVEMALVLPIFIFVLIGVFDFGRALHAWSSLNHQCIQAARAATKRAKRLVDYGLAAHPSLTEVQAAFWQYRSPLMPEVSYANLTFKGVGTGDKTVEVGASFNLTLYTPAMGGLLGGENKDGAITISASASEQKE